MILFFKEIGEKGGLEEQTREEEQSIFHFWSMIFSHCLNDRENSEKSQKFEILQQLTAFFHLS